VVVHINIAINCVLIAALNWFFAWYTGIHAKWFLLVSTGFYGLLFIVNLIHPQSILHKEIIGLEAFLSPWGESVTLIEGTPSIWGQLAAVNIFAGIAFAFFVLIAKYRQDRSRTTLTMLFAQGWLCATFIEGVFARIGYIHFVPLGLFGYSGMIIVMGQALNREISANRKRAEEEIRSLNADLEQRVAERTAELEAASQRFSVLFNASTNPHCIVDMNGRIVDCNPALLDLMGYSDLSEISGIHPAAFSPARQPDGQDSLTKGAIMIDLAIKKRRHTFEWWQQGKSGEEIPIEVTIVPVTLEGRPHLMGIWYDLRRRLAIEQELRHASRVLDNFKTALDEHAIVAITNATGKITYVNDKFCVISQYSRDELIGQDHRVINSGHHPKEFIRDLWETITTGRVWKGELKNRAKDGSSYWVDTTIVPLLGGDGKPQQYIAIRADITTRKQAEENILRLNLELLSQTTKLSEANQELEAFSYSVSHDLRAPLRHIHGYVEMLTKATQGQLSDKAQRYLKTISEAGAEMNQLIDDLLAFSRTSRTEMREDILDLDQVVTNALRSLELETKNRNILWKIAPLPPAIGDAALVKQVFFNLISNAVKYSRQRNPAQIDIGYAGEENGRYIYFVRDNGAGFDMQYANKLFGVFQRLHRPEDFEGTGIGLAIVHRILVRHGNRIWAQGEVDRGATFYFSLKPVALS
jgi:PAS domain S-box-containing protein